MSYISVSTDIDLNDILEELTLSDAKELKEGINDMFPSLMKPSKHDLTPQNEMVLEAIEKLKENVFRLMTEQEDLIINLANKI
jgi:hypothetical protein